MSETLASFLLPVRNATESTMISLRSIKDTASNTIPYEILIRFDDDDESYDSLIPQVQELFEGTMAEVTVVIGPRHGYEGLHHYYNELAKLSVGKLLLLWNDDVQILKVKGGWNVTGHGKDFPMYEFWDILLQEDELNREDNINVLFPTEVYWQLPEAAPGVVYEKQITNLAFPILTRHAYEVLGHFAMSPLNDAYLLDISIPYTNGIPTRKRSRLMLLHLPAFHEETGLSLRTDTPSYKLAYNLHYSQEVQDQGAEDREKLQKFWEAK